MMFRTCMRAAVAAALIGLLPAAASAQMQIKVNDSVSVKVGFLTQVWGDFNQNVRQDTSYAQSIFLRRLRLFVGGQVGSHLTFFLGTDAPNLGRTTSGTAKNLGGAVIMEDAYVEVKPGRSNAFLLDAGLQYVPLCRNCIQSAATLLPVDYSSYSFLQNGPTGSSNGRDVGLQAKGYLAHDRVEYRAGVFSGARLPSGTAVTSSNALRGAGRIQVQLLETEAPAYTYTGTYFGKRKVLALGAGVDAQSSYRAWAADAFLSYPVGTDGITAQADFIHYDGSEFFGAALPRQNTVEMEAGYHFNAVKFTPFAKFETRNVDDALPNFTATQDESRVQLGGTYYLSGHNLNFKGAWTRGTIHRAPPVGGVTPPAYTQNGFTVQVQGFYY